MEFIQTRQLKTAVDFLKRSGGINPFLVEPLHLINSEDGKARSITMEEKSEKDTKKKVSFMGGNLYPVTSNFYKKNNLSAQEPIVLDEYENENNDVTISVLIEGMIGDQIGWKNMTVNTLQNLMIRHQNIKGNNGINKL